jgi:hypothetical protein
MRVSTSVRDRVRRAALLAAVLAAGVVTAVGAAQAASLGAKPGPESGAASGGARVAENAAGTKEGVAAGAPATLVGGKAPAGAVSPALSGYVVAKVELVNPAFSQTFGKADCPAGTVAFGGGVLSNSVTLLQNVNSTYPIVSGGVATGWGGYVDNASPDDLVFLVYAVCATKPANYAVVGVTLDNPPSTQTSGTVTCPVGSTGTQMKPFGGGGFGSSSGVDQNLNTTIPVKGTRGWRVDMNNASGTDASVTVYAVCGLRSGWSVVKGSAVATGPNSQTFVRALCPAGRTSVGGGIYSSSSSTAVDLNGSYPDASSSWLSYENNASQGSSTITPYAVCLA